MAAIRAPLLMFIVVPLSFLMRTYFHIQTVLFQHFFWDPKKHEKNVQKICQDVLKWNKGGRKKKLRTARPTWMTMSTRLGNMKAGYHLVDFTQMNNILEIDEENLTILCEPCVTMGQITHLLTSKNLALLVQIEMESITIGGLVFGTGMETNGHKDGLFQESVISYELVMSDGTIKFVTAENDPELFYALPWSYGSIAFLTAVRIKLRRIKPYVKVNYIPTHSVEDLAQKMKTMALDENAPTFLEATVYSKDEAVIQAAEFVDWDDSMSKIYNPIGKYWKPWYYKHVETALKIGSFSEVMPVCDYYHRFTKSIFWELEDMIPFSNHWLYRYLWAWMGPPEVSLLKKFQGQIIRRASIYAHVVQDIIVPIRELQNAVEGFHKWFECYPLLLFPVRIYDHSPYDGMLTTKKENLQEGKDWAMYFDLGAYGVPQLVRDHQKWDPIENCRAMEDYTRESNGWQFLYTDTFHTHEEFQQMFNLNLINKARKKHGSVGCFPTVYEKIRPEKGLIEHLDREHEKLQSLETQL